MFSLRNALLEHGNLMRKKILDAISGTPKSAIELSKEMGLHITTINKHLKILREPGKRMAWISRWDYVGSGGSATPFYAQGDFPDVVKPEHLPRERKPRIRKRKLTKQAAPKPEPKQEPRVLIVNRLGQKPSKITPPPAVNDPMLSWMIPRKEHREVA